MRGSIKVKAADPLCTLPVGSSPELQPGEQPLPMSSMRSCPGGTALPVLLLLLLLATVPIPAQPSCLHFPELLPAKLKELRVKFEEIKDYFVSIVAFFFFFVFSFRASCRVLGSGGGGRASSRQK